MCEYRMIELNWIKFLFFMVIVIVLYLIKLVFLFLNITIYKSMELKIEIMFNLIL